MLYDLPNGPCSLPHCQYDLPLFLDTARSWWDSGETPSLSPLLHTNRNTWKGMRFMSYVPKCRWNTILYFRSVHYLKLSLSSWKIYKKKLLNKRTSFYGTNFSIDNLLGFLTNSYFFNFQLMKFWVYFLPFPERKIVFLYVTQFQIWGQNIPFVNL